MACYDPRAHNLDNITGYRVRQSIASGERLQPQPLVEEIIGATNYPQAIDRRNNVRYTHTDAVGRKRILSWAVITPIYGDGCEGQPF